MLDGRNEACTKCRIEDTLRQATKYVVKMRLLLEKTPDVEREVAGNRDGSIPTVRIEVVFERGSPRELST